MGTMDISRQCREGTVLTLPLPRCTDFIAALQRGGLALSGLGAMKGGDFFRGHRDAVDSLVADILVPVRDHLDDPARGFIGLDVPAGIADDPTTDALMGGFIAAAITSVFMTPALDVRNGTPFTVYTASAGNERALQDAGVAFHSPSGRLGFHTDGLLRDKAIHLPHLLALYNIVIAYNKPGCFYWAPFATWPAFDDWAERVGWNRRYRFVTTPIVYAGALDAASETTQPSTAPFTEAPVFWRDEAGQTRAVFLNGEVLGPVDGNPCGEARQIARLKDDIARHAHRLAIPQRQRRMFLMNNTAGFHARDLFDAPVPGARYTRSFMRSVSLEGPRIA